MLTMTLVVALLYAFGSLIFRNGLEQYFSMKLQGLMGVMIGLATFFIMLIVSWLINYMVKFMLERRSAEFGIYLLLGMKKRTIAGLYIRENFLLGGVSFLIGTAAGILLQQVLMAVMFPWCRWSIGFLLRRTAGLYLWRRSALAVATCWRFFAVSGSLRR